MATATATGRQTGTPVKSTPRVATVKPKAKTAPPSTVTHKPVVNKPPAPAPVTQAELTRNLANLESQIAAMNATEQASNASIQSQLSGLNGTDATDTTSTPASSSTTGTTGVLSSLASGGTSTYLIVAAVGLGGWFLWKRSRGKVAG